MPEPYNTIVAVAIGLPLMAAAFVAVIAWALHLLGDGEPSDE